MRAQARHLEQMALERMGLGLMALGLMGCSRARISDTAWSAPAARDSGQSFVFEPLAEVVFNEVMASGNDVEGDWLELVSLESVPVDLGGWQLSDDWEDDLGWTIPANTVVGPRGHLVVTAAGEGGDELSAPFRLSSAGETLTLVDPRGTVVDEVVFPALEDDTVYARIPDATGDWQVTVAVTMGSVNRERAR